MTEFDTQFKRMKTDAGFIAALDQSGGSTPKTLANYGISPDAWADDDGMFDLMHAMRSRIMTTPSFDGRRILGAILFEDTMNRMVAGRPTPEYLWQVKDVVPFLKVDKGLAEEASGVQLMAPINGLGELLGRAKALGIFGTKMRSVIKQRSPGGINQIVAQQFEIGQQIITAGLVPILEPETDIHCPDKAAAEDLLKADLLKQLDTLDQDQYVILKLTLPEVANQYQECINHPQVLRVVALSGGYSRNEANDRLGRNHGMIASFSRALSEGLTAEQSDDEFDAVMDKSIESIFQASCT